MSLPPSPPQPPTSTPTTFQVFAEHFWKLISGVVLLVGAAYVIHQNAYTQGKDAGAGALAVYEKSKEFKFEEIAKRAEATTANLEQASKMFEGILATNAEYVTARDQLAAAREMIKRHEELNALLAQQHDDMAKSVAEAKKDLEDMTSLGRTYVIEKGKSEIIVGGALNFGVHNVKPDLTAAVYVDGEERITYVGDKFDKPGKNGTTCKFNTRSVEYFHSPERISVDALCEKN
ncbi:hypothetical protein [Agrobacterium tumefaciens]|jgi:hydroxymethylpyrimidine/phosphomethylpyrimidine kinase|uniref:hypothetical protein n=1 Tax=Agrobacterium tumefaciens TaxID=358 RepID=UPI000B23F2D3